VSRFVTRLTQPLANRFREVVSGSKDGEPPWVDTIARGADAGLFGPDNAVWTVHGSVSTLVGGIRALLLQAAHPAALSGVADHSRFESDPLGRLAGTTRWLTITTFGSTTAVAAEAARVHGMHARVTGTFATKDGDSRPYAARDPRFLLWVHCAFTDSFLKAHQRLGFPLPQGADRYVSEWRRSAEPLGLRSAPASVAELEAALQTFREHDLVATDVTRRVVGFILAPPFSRAGLLFYRVLANAAIATLDERDVRLLGLKPRRAIWLRLARMLLDVLSVILGRQSPSERRARQRIAACDRAGGGAGVPAVPESVR
jgi:uncharacterized protein (DUF2236 family)